MRTSQFIKPLKIFVSYAREDEALMRRVVAQLSGLVRDDSIEVWTDGRILAGARWHDEILKRLLEADIVLLLISEDFLNSAFIMEVEFEEAMQRQDEGKTVVVPVILRYCLWRTRSFGVLWNQALPKGGKPVKDDLAVLDSRLVEVAEGIEALVKSLCGDGDVDESRTAPASGRTKTMLPYLCDRSRQDAMLETRLLEHRKRMPHRPFLCLVHGDEHERHDLFLERLRVTSLKRILDLGAEVSAGNVYRLRWPPEFVNKRETKEMFTADLGISLGRNRENMAAFLAQHEPPVIIYSEVLTREWGGGGGELTRIFLDFWNRWPYDLPPGRVLIICLFLKYERRDAAQGGFDYPESAKAIREFLAKLKFSRYDGMGGVVLPELEPIGEREILVWGTSAELRSQCAIWENQDRFEKDVAAIYSTTDKPRLTMGDLKPYLDAIVVKYWRGKRR